jgi:hypothetical protein
MTRFLSMAVDKGDANRLVGDPDGNGDARSG